MSINTQRNGPLLLNFLPTVFVTKFNNSLLVLYLFSFVQPLAQTCYCVNKRQQHFGYTVNSSKERKDWRDMVSFSWCQFPLPPPGAQWRVVPLGAICWFSIDTNVSGTSLPTELGNRFLGSSPKFLQW